MVVTIIVLSLLVLLHELGHFLVAKLFKIKVEEFGIGLPPKALTIFKKGETEYSLNWLPIGGFVRLAGEVEDPTLWQKLNPATRSRAFFAKPAWQRTLVLLAGVAMNIFVGITLFSVIYAHLGVPQYGGDQVVVADVAKGSPADLASIKQGDVITGVAGGVATSADQFVAYVNAHKGQMTTFYVAQLTPDGTVSTSSRQVQVVPRENPPAGQGALGVSVVTVPVVTYLHKPWYTAPFYGTVEGLKETYGWTVMFLSIFTHPKELLANIGGPVKVVETGAQVATEGWVAVTRFAAIISLNLGIFNLLPIPALDGGRVAMVLLEKFIGRKRVAKMEGYVNLAGMGLLILLLIGVTVKDVFFG